MLLTLLIALVTFRLTRLFTRDKLPLVAVPREAFVNRWGTYVNDEDQRVSISDKKTNLFMRSLAYLWECDWCLSLWIAPVVVAVADFYVAVPYPYLQVFAASAITGLIAQREPK